MMLSPDHLILAFTPGPWQVVLIVFVVLLLFGGKKLPGLAHSIGQSLNEFKRGKEEGASKADDVATTASADVRTPEEIATSDRS